MDQGSRLRAVRLDRSHAVCDVLGLEAFNEDHLYGNLAWLAERQEAIEKRLFRHRYGNTPPQLFLYDVTSSYLEGVQNILAAFGYNRDGKKGKRQLVIGLLTGPEGAPVAVRVFAGNTADKKTVPEQIRILAESFGVKEVTLVGDRGMLKQAQIDLLNQEQFHYITAITQPQIEKLLREGVFQMGLFEEKLAEVAHDGVRYKDLAQVERAFRTFKNGHLEVQPTFVRIEASTRGHVFVVMLAYLVERELEQCWRGLETTVAEGIDDLGSLRGIELTIGQATCQQVPEPTGLTKQLLDAANIKLPEVLPCRKVHVATRKKLVSERG
jgi:transposase